VPRDGVADDFLSDRFSRELFAARQTAGELEGDNVRLGSEIASVRANLANLERQLAKETTSVRTLGDEKQLLLEGTETADRRIIELEADAALARERLALLENEKVSLQTALDRTLAEASRTSRQLAESENALHDARARLLQTESSLAAVEAERKRLSAAYDESKERRQTEVYALSLKHDAVLSRSAVAEKLLADVRRNLATRSEEIRILESKLMEATLARSGAEKKAERLSGELEARDGESKKRERVHLTLIERNKVLSETVQAREGSLAHAQEKIRSLSDRITHLRLEADVNRGKAEKRIEELSAAIERARVEHSLAEGALEMTRENYAQVQRKFSTERATRRSSNSEETLETTKAGESNHAKSGTGPDGKVVESLSRHATAKAG
jgi:chromosome segregation ATPase